MFINPTFAFVTAVSESEQEGGDLLEKLYLEHYKRLFNVSRKILGNSADAEDAVANAYIKIFAHIDSFEALSDDDTKKLLTTYVVNASIDFDRNRKAKKNSTVSLTFSSDDSGKEFEIPDEAAALDEMLISKERIQTLALCIDKLPDVDRQIILLKYRYRYSGKKIAQIIGISVSAVNNRASRAKEKLCSMMEDSYGK